MTMLISSRVSLSSALSIGLLLASTACYSVDFDAQQTDVYYCMADDECLETQACSQFRCVDNAGPKIKITGPEEVPPTVLPLNQTEVLVQVDVKDFTLAEGNDVEDGFGKLLLAIDPHKANPITMFVDQPGAALPLGAGLSAGPHRIVATAVYGDATPYANPGASDHTVFFSSDMGPRPQIAVLEPGPGHVHVVGEPFAITVISLNFDFIPIGPDCHVAEGCDPFDPNVSCTLAEPECMQISKGGHAHVYLRPDYPGCLSDVPVNCNDDYIMPLLPMGTDNPRKMSQVIPAVEFEDVEPGEYTLRVGMQYSNHKPYPNTSFIIYDELPITIVER